VTLLLPVIFWVESVQVRTAERKLLNRRKVLEHLPGLRSYCIQRAIIRRLPPLPQVHIAIWSYEPLTSLPCLSPLGCLWPDLTRGVRFKLSTFTMDRSRVVLTGGVMFTGEPRTERFNVNHGEVLPEIHRVSEPSIHHQKDN
jgi:hypothetical protein